MYARNIILLYDLGELTRKGYNKRKLDVMMRLLELEFKAGCTFITCPECEF